jgi:hypothetical protein
MFAAKRAIDNAQLRFPAQRPQKRRQREFAWIASQTTISFGALLAL